MDCEQARELIEGRLDEMLTPADACALDQHLAACRECSSSLGQSQALARDLAGLPRPEIGEATWDQWVDRAVAEGTARLRDRRDRRAIRRLAWATAAVWFAAWLLGSHVLPRTSRPAPLAAVPAIGQVGAPDADAGAEEPYEGSLARPIAAMYVGSTHGAATLLPRSVVIERLLAGEDLPDEPDADQAPRAPGPKSPDRRPGVEERGHV